MSRSTYVPNPKTDLVLERVVDVPPELVWAAWTQPEHLKNWFTPAPWKTIDAEIDLRPGGIFRTTMLSPEGQQFPNVGCYLEVIDGAKPEAGARMKNDAVESAFRIFGSAAAKQRRYDGQKQDLFHMMSLRDQSSQPHNSL